MSDNDEAVPSVGAPALDEEALPVAWRVTNPKGDTLYFDDEYQPSAEAVAELDSTLTPLFEHPSVGAGVAPALDEAGRCGEQTPTIGGAPTQHCALPAGHAGWHKADAGTEWGVSDGAGVAVSALDLDAIEAVHYAWTPEDSNGAVYCVDCGMPWPCHTANLLAEVRRLSVSAPAVEQEALTVDRDALLAALDAHGSAITGVSGFTCVCGVTEGQTGWGIKERLAYSGHAAWTEHRADAVLAALGQRSAVEQPALVEWGVRNIELAQHDSQRYVQRCASEAEAVARAADSVPYPAEVVSRSVGRWSSVSAEAPALDQRETGGDRHA